MCCQCQLFEKVHNAGETHIGRDSLVGITACQIGHFGHYLPFWSLLVTSCQYW